MAKYKFSLKNLQYDPFNFYINAANSNKNFFQKRMLPFSYIQISTYSGMKELFKHEHLQKPKSYKTIGDAYKLSGVLINNGEDWKKAKSSLQKTIFNVTKEELEQIASAEFEVFSQHLKTNEFFDILPLLRTYIQQCLNKIIFDFNSWDKSSYISHTVRAIEVACFQQQWSLSFNLFRRNLQFYRTRKIPQNLYDFYVKKIRDHSKNSRFSKWTTEISKLGISPTEQDQHKIFPEICNLWIAGNEATSNTLAWTLDLIAKALEKSPNLLQDEQFIPGSLQEAQRIYPAAYLLAREAKEDIETEHGLIKRGSVVNFSTYSMNRDLDYFDSPEDFNYLRAYKNLNSNKPPFSFGHGKRICSGKAMSEVLMDVFLKKILEKFSIHKSQTNPIPYAHVSLTSQNGFIFKFIPKRKIP